MKFKILPRREERNWVGEAPLCFGWRGPGGVSESKRKMSLNVLGGVAGVGFSEHLGLTASDSNSGDPIQILNPSPPAYDALKGLLTAHFLSCPLLSFPLLCFEGPVITCWLQTCQSWQACWLDWVWACGLIQFAHAHVKCPLSVQCFLARVLTRLYGHRCACVPLIVIAAGTHGGCKSRKNQEEVKLLFLWDLCLRVAFNLNTCTMFSIF